MLNPNDSQGVHRIADMGSIPDDPGSNYVVTFTRGGPSGAIDTITKTKDGISWVRTLTYSGADLMSVSAWVRA